MKLQQRHAGHKVRVIAPPPGVIGQLGGKTSDYRAEIEAKVVALARKHHVSYAKSALDKWAGHVTRLVEEELDVDDPVKEALRALQRAGKISRKHMFKMMMEYVTGRPSA
ncbi:MAG TPA: hypothetical protein VGN46_14160 [Luteibacter sp.]|jgi:hypothetical protein|uniref:hypothetical protein n=1 Tax=Luteibacter sp. TaxID=1886636 RepID=UPI002F3EF711